MKHFNVFGVFGVFAIARIGQFDDVTRFRLQNSFIVGIGISLLAPVLIILKGSLLPLFIISGFSIIATLSVRTNSYFTTFTIPQLYHMGVGAHILLVISAFLYFINPLWMVVMESLLGILEISVFSAYGILLTEHLTNIYPLKMKNFQIVKNNVWSDSTIIGLIFASIIGGLLSTGVVVGVFIIYNTVFSIYMIKNWSYLEEVLGL